MKKIKFVTLLVVFALTTTVCFAQEKEMNYLFGEQSKIKSYRVSGADNGVFAGRE